MKYPSMDIAKEIVRYETLRKDGFIEQEDLTEAGEIQRKLLSRGAVCSNIDLIFDTNTGKYTVLDRDIRTKTMFSKQNIEQHVKHFCVGGVLPDTFEYAIESGTIAFKPHEGRIIEGRFGVNLNSYSGNKYLNIASENNIEKLNWIKYPNMELLCDNLFGRHKDDFMNWLAFGAKNKVKSGVAWVTLGTQGTGKGVLYKRVIKKLFDGYTSQINNSSIVNNFNAWQLDKLFVNADEIAISSQNKDNAEEIIKSLITEEVQQVTSKGIDTQDKETYYNMWFTSNKNKPYNIDSDDRRLSITTAKKPLKKIVPNGDIAPFLKALDGEVEGFLIELMGLEVVESKAREAIETIDKEEVIEYSLNSFEYFAKKLKENEYDEIVETMDMFDVNGGYSTIEVSECVSEMIDSRIGIKTKAILHHIFTGRKSSIKIVSSDFARIFGRPYSTTVKGKAKRVTKIPPFYPIETIDGEIKEIEFFTD